MLHFWKQQASFKPAEVRSADLHGQTAVITGSNTGVGFHTARQLLDLGLTRLILAVRNQDKGNAAAARLYEAYELAEGTAIEVWPLDLSSYESVMAFAQRARSLNRLDIVNLNAGIGPAKRVFNANTGHDEVIQVNYLSTALLAILLLPVAEEKRSNQPRPSRITLTLSEVASWTKFTEQTETSLLKSLDSKQGKVDMLDRMCVSKLLGQFLLVQLAAAVPPSVALINGASPGAVHDSEFGREFDKTFAGAVYKKLVLKHLGNSSEMAAWAMTDAIVNHGNETHGKFLSFQKVAPMAPIVSSERGQQVSDRLWKETMEELSFANVEEIVRTFKD
ncbi:hypothetical protein N8I77_013647 [Diaporthe amygdali]|uniref:Uncharacterized protein n=1 Tax=Phomopsis amygdali TaxID=1214568 RepID=A0AAD9S3D2_PHOAM|nr:hypothetical protein N8I77_013647 [Diaporthe amygdali]